MRREILCRLAGIDAETFKSMSKRSELPFAQDETRGVGDYSLNEALMLRVALELRSASMSRGDVGRTLGHEWGRIWERAKELSKTVTPDVYLGIITARAADGSAWVGVEIGSLYEIEAMARQSRETHDVLSNSYAERLYRHRRYWKRDEPQKRFGGAPLFVTALSLANVSQAFRDLVARANAESVEIPADFLEFFGA